MIYRSPPEPVHRPSEEWVERYAAWYEHRAWEYRPTAREAALELLAIFNTGNAIRNEYVDAIPLIRELRLIAAEQHPDFKPNGE